LGTALAGWLTLPFLYLFAREFAGRHVGLAAMFLAGIAFWPNLLARTGLRFALLPLFAAPAVYFLVRGLGGQRRNDILLAGLFAGSGCTGTARREWCPWFSFSGFWSISPTRRRAAGGPRTCYGWAPPPWWPSPSSCPLPIPCSSCRTTSSSAC
jgi:hypothetical protein